MRAPGIDRGSLLAKGPPWKVLLRGSHASPPAICRQVWEKLAWRGGAGSALGPSDKDPGEGEDLGSRSGIFEPSETSSFILITTLLSLSKKTPQNQKTSEILMEGVFCLNFLFSCDLRD